MDVLNSIKDKVSDAADSVVEAVKDTGMSAACKVAEARIKELTGSEIEVETDNVPEDWKTWIMKTGVNSLCTEDTWDFLEKSEYNQKKVDLWEQRGIDKIVLTVAKDDEVDEWTSPWVVAMVDWEKDSKTFIIKFYPRAKNWESSSTWLEPGGGKCWWILRDEIVFGLQLYQLPGKCFYKSDWLSGFQDFDADAVIPKSKKAFDRWFQFRHWTIFWFGKAQWGWNYQWTTSPPKNADGSDFSLDSVLKMPSMPDISMPSISLPSLPDVSMPSLPDVSMPSIEAPSLEAPSLSAPDMSNLSAPSIPDTPKRPKNPWAAHGILELTDLKMQVKGKEIIFHNAKRTDFFQEDHGIKTENSENQKIEVECTTAEQANSWLLSLAAVGVKEEDAPGCCTVA